jgi:hypothetical protein
MIYAHLVEGGNGKIGLGYDYPLKDYITDPEIPEIFQLLINDAKDKNIQHENFAMNPAFVGLPMAREIAEVYYSQNTFYCSDEGQIRNLIHGDPLNIDLSRLCTFEVSTCA